MKPLPPDAYLRIQGQGLVLKRSGDNVAIFDPQSRNGEVSIQRADLAEVIAFLQDIHAENLKFRSR